MPRVIDFGEPYGTREFPDNATDEDIVAAFDREQAARFNPQEFIQQAGRSVITGAARELAATPKTVGIISGELRRKVGYVPGLDFPTREGETFDTSPQASEAYKLGQLIERGGEAIAPAAVPELQESFLATKVPEAVGSGVGFLLGGGVARLLRRGVTSATARAAERELAEAAAKKGASLGTKALAAVSEGAEIGTLGAVSQFQSEYEKAINAGADRDTALKAGVLGLPIGATEAIPLSNMLRRLDRFSDGGFTRYLITAGKEAFEEGLQEAAQNFASNAVEKGLYNEAKSLTDDLIPQAGAGGAAGFLLSTLTQALGAGVRRARKGPSEATATPQQQGAAPSEARVAPAATAPIGETAPGEVRGPVTAPPTTPTAKPITAYAESPRTPPEAPSIQTQGMVSGAETPVRVRLPAENRVETEAGAITVPAATAPAALPIPIAERLPVVQQAVAAVTSQWQGAPPIEVVATAAELPPEILQRAAAAEFSPNQIQGFTQDFGADRGKVWLVAENLANDEEARRIVLHETVGHSGVERVLAQRAPAFYQSVAQRHAATDLGREVRAQYGESPEVVGSEILARLAERPEADPTLWQRVVAMVREWARRVFNVNVSDNDIRVLLARSRRILERPAVAGTVPVVADRSRFAVTPPAAQPQFFQTRAQVEAAVADPLLQDTQRQEARDLAAVQSSMVNQGFMGWWMGTPVDDADALAHKKLDYIADRRFLADKSKALSSLPRTTQPERSVVEMAGAKVLAHYGIDRATERELNSDLEAKVEQQKLAVAKLPKLQAANLKAHFLTAMFNFLTGNHKTYLANLSKAEPASGNLQAQFRERLNLAQQRLNTQEQAPGTLKAALSALATTVPDTLLLPGTSNTAITQWALENGALQTVVPQDVQQWMLVDDGTGQPALNSYEKLREDLVALRDILSNQEAVAKDIEDYEKWFRPSGKTGKIPPKALAESYFKMRTARDRAARIAGAIEKEIGDLDTQIRGNIIAKDRLQTLMSSPEYVETVRQAAQDADVVTQVLFEPSTKSGVGLIDRDQNLGFWNLKVPGSENEYAVDLYPSSAQEKENRSRLSAYVAEARQYAADNQDDPLLADEHVRIADYIEKFLLHPSLDPSQGFTQLPWMQIPGTSIRLSPDIYDHWTSLTGLPGLSFHTVRDVLERIGGRVTRQVMKDAYALDVVMKRVEGINANPKYGYQAQVQAVLKAIESHGWSTDQFAMWDEKVAEPVLAAGQNNLGPTYQTGDTIVGSGVRLTKEDAEALRLMKQWEDEVLKAAPPHIQERLGDLGVIRKAVGTGRYTMARLPAVWTRRFVDEWTQAGTDAEKIALLDRDPNFRRVVMGYLGEFNPELSLMNNASGQKSPLFMVYRRLAETEKNGIQNFTNWNEVLDFLANEMVKRGISPDFSTARESAEATLLSEIDKFMQAFRTNVLNYKSDAVWGGVPPAVVEVASANNAFTTPRGLLQAPSTFYSYSTASDGRRLMHVGGLRSLMNLKLLQSAEESFSALQKKKEEIEEQINKLVTSGLSKRAATKQVLDQTMRDRKASEIRYDYRELTTALRMMGVVVHELRRFESSTPEHYQHAGIEALQNVFGTLKSSLLSSTQAMSTNTWSGLLMGPATIHWQTGQYLRALRDVLPSPVGGTPRVVQTLYRQISAMVARNPIMSKLLKKHAPMWNWLSKQIVDAAADWHRVQKIAEMSGMVSPYNLRKVWQNRAALKGTGGRLTTELDAPGIAQLFNTIFSAPGIRHIVEPVKAAFPRKFDDFINYSLIVGFEKELEFLKKLGWTAFQAREDAAQKSGADWTDLTNANNVLTPGDLGLSSHKALERYRQLFAPVGSLDGVLLDYYQRTKGMSQEQREAEPLIQDENDLAGLALYHASVSNVPTETTRPQSLKGKGSDGVWRNIAGTFMGWTINATKQLSKGLQTHSADPQFSRIAQNFIGLAVIFLLMAAVGAWNWEFGDELTKLVTDVSSARIQPGNIQDVPTAMGYLAQALVNTVPVIGSIIGSMAGVAFTGRGSPFDMTSQILHLNLASDTYNTAKRIIQTGDATLPLADYVRRWVFPPLTRGVINRLPLMRGLTDQQNAVRALNASAPPGTEIKWGQRSGGDFKYGPANDEIQKLIASAYEASAHGGRIEDVQARLEDAIQAYMKTGRSRPDAIKAVGAALATKEPIRILTGREMTPEEEKRWVSRMTGGQKADYNRAVEAWKLLGGVTGRDLGMVNYPSGGGTGGGFGRGGVVGIPSAIPRGRRIGGRIGGLRRVGSLRRVSAGRAPRLAVRRAAAPRLGRRRSLGLRSPRIRGPRLQRLAGPRVTRLSAGRKRLGLPSRRRRRQAVAA
jgi:hypothetical protein